MEDGESLPSSDILQKAFTFFFPYYFTMKSPFEIPDMQKVVDVLKNALQDKNKKILFYGDRDADGICSLSIFFLFFRDLLSYPEKNLIALLPREEDKYGITQEVAERIISYEPDILITLDCGSSNKQEIGTIQEKLDVQVIVIDHHFIPEKKEDYPKIEAFLNPKRLKTPNVNRELCTSGISLKVLWAFIYSFTKEYETKYHYSKENTNKSIYFKNLVRIDEKEYFRSDHRKKIILDDASTATREQGGAEEIIDLKSTWHHTSYNNPLFRKVSHFLKIYPNSISDEEKIRFLFQANMKKLKKKVSPFLALSAIGTVADMVPLTNDNRILVSEGLKFINENLKSQIQADYLVGTFSLLQTLFSHQEKITEEDMTFNVCPVLNAAGRLGDASLALNTLLERDRLTAAKLAFDLKSLNKDRKKISHQAFLKVKDELGQQEDKPMIIIHDPAIHRGISGLLANRLSNQYKKPALLMVDDGDCIRGSIRAYKNEDVFSFVQLLESFFIQYGGHRQAAGFSIEYSLKDAFIQKAKEISAVFFEEKNPNHPNDNTSEMQKDAFKAIEFYDHEIKTSIWEECKVFAPFGKNNPHPVLSIRITQPIKKNSFGEGNNHLKIKMQGSSDEQIEGIWFFHNGEAERLTEEYDSYRILAEPHIHEYKGIRSYRLNIKEVIPAFIK